MKETTKAQKRRVRELERNEFPWGDVFKGQGIDVGSGDDALRDCKNRIADTDQSVSFNLPDGGGDSLLDHFKKEEFSFVHASQVLEHAIDPVVMLRSWIECLKPGGYIVATVPDWKLYEKCTWPSRYNAGHRSTWSLDTPIWATTGYDPEKNANRIHCKLPEWLLRFQPTCGILLCRLIDTSDHSIPETVDQTFPADGAEVFIEFVLLKQ